MTHGLTDAGELLKRASEFNQQTKKIEDIV